MYKLYGIPVSQPYRSVVWTMLQLGVPFEMQITLPGLTSEIGTKHENFLSLTPYRHNQIPLLIVDGEVGIGQSSAIMAYLCDRYGKKDSAKNTLQLYAPPGSTERALIDSYIIWHHVNTRKLNVIISAKTRKDLNWTATDADYEKVKKVLAALDQGWLSYSPTSKFIAGSKHATIADILAFGEISALTMTNLITIDSATYPKVTKWMKEMSALPYYEAAHKVLWTLGDLSADPIDRLDQRLGEAIEAGFQALKEAKANFTLK